MEDKPYSCEGALSRKLAVYLNSTELADITIKVGQRLFPAHRLVLGSWSDQLAGMIENSTGNIIEVRSDASEKETEVFESVLCFLYTGKITFNVSNVKMVMSLASKLGLTKLGEMAKDWVGDLIDRGTMVNAITWLRDAKASGLSSLEARCLHTLALHFQYIPEASWLGLSSEEIYSIFDHDVVVNDEIVIIKRIDVWLTAKGNVADNEVLYQELAKRIIIPFIEISKLLSLQETSPIVKFAVETSPKVVSEALKYRALSSELGDKTYDCTDNCQNAACSFLKSLDIKPRLYLNFITPGDNQNWQERSGDEYMFREIRLDSYDLDIRCAIKVTHGSWISGLSCITVVPKLESHHAGDTEVWSVKYEAHVQYLQEMATFKLVIVTKPLDKDSEFYLPDNPMVVTSADSWDLLQDTKSLSPIIVSTPPIFAGRKPQRMQVASHAYITTKTITSHE